MGEPKPTASLSGGLLARKGGARPAMRRPAMVGTNGEAASAQDDLGWNDMGYDVNPAPDAPMDHDHDSKSNPLAGAVPEVGPEVRQQQLRIAQQLQAQPETEYPKEKIAEAAKPTSLPVGGVWTSEPEVEAETPVAEKAAVTPKPAAPVAQAEEAPQPVPAAAAPKKRAAPGSKSKAAFTLRLDKERHLKLRLACAVRGKSAQNLVTDALDKMLDNMPEVEQLAANVPDTK